MDSSDYSTLTRDVDAGKLRHYTVILPLRTFPILGSTIVANSRNRLRHVFSVLRRAVLILNIYF